MKNFNNLITMTNVMRHNSQTAVNPDGRTTVNRQSRLMSLSGKKAEKEQLSPSCPRDAFETLSTCPRYILRIALIFSMFVLSIGQMWGATYTWTFDNSANNNDIDLSTGTTALSSYTTSGKSMSYVGGSSCKIPKKTTYLAMGGASIQSSNALSTRYFILTAPSANGTISVTFAGTASGNELIRTDNGDYQVIATGTSTTKVSSLLSGLTAGTTKIYIAFTGKCYISSIAWTDADAPETLTTLYSSDYKSSMESGASISVSSGMGEQTGGSGWVSAYSKYYKATSTNKEATITFSPALSLVSDGNDRGKIRIYYGSLGHSLNTTVINDFKINGGSSIGTAYGVIEKEKVHVIEYTIPVGTSTLTTIYNKVAVTNGCLLHVEVLTHSAGGGDVTAPTLSSSSPANDATNVATSGNITLTFSENVTIVDASKFSLSGGTGTLNTASASASGAVVTIPYSGLANNTTYTLATAEGAVKDASNNTSAELSSITFKTIKASHTVTAATSTGTNTYGTVSAAASSVAEGETTTITAVPASGYRVTNWAVSGTGASISPSGASNANSTTLTMGTADATVTVTFGAIPSHTITYTNTKSMDNSANPTSYYEGVGVASFTKLRHAVGYDFTGWSPSSISSSATTNQTIDAQWSANAVATGTGTLTYALAFSSGTITTSSITRNNGALYDATDVSLDHTSFADDANKNGCSGKLTTTSAKDASKYVELTFKIADGYTFTPTEVQVKGNAVTTAKTMEVELKDNAATPNTKSVSGALAEGSTSGGSTVTLDFDASGTVTLEGTVTLKIFVYGAADHWRLGTSVIVNGTVAPACTAPSSVSVAKTTEDGNYGWRYTTGETLKLTATATGGSGGSYTYQWKKKTGESTWKNLTDGVDATDGGTFSGTTSANLVISGLTAGNAGTYKCVVSTGLGCDTESNEFWVRVFTLDGNYSGEDWIKNPIVWTDEYNGTATVTLDANSVYQFKVTDNDSHWYGLTSPDIYKDEDNFVIYRNDANNVALHTGKVAGTYTFTVNVYHANDNETPKITLTAVRYPKMTIYMSGGSTTWCDSDPVFFAHTYGQANNDVKMTAHTCESGLFYADVPSYNTKVIFTRQKTGSESIAWEGENFWNKSDEITIGSNNKFTCTGWNTTPEPDQGSFSGSVYSPTTYTVSAAVSTAGYGTVSAASVTGVACETSISASTNTLTVGATNVTAAAAVASAEYTYAFTNWTWTPAGATVTSNVTATANFTRTPKSYTLTWNLAGGKVTVAGTGAAVNATGTPNSEVAFGTAITAPTVTKTGYNFSAWSSTPASTMPAANTTYTATWTAKTTTITIDANTENHGSTAPSPITATYGNALSSFTAATGASGYSLTGYFTAATSGTKVINADGTLVASTDYADGSGNWKYETSTLTLYPQYEEEVDDCYSEVAKVTLTGKDTAPTCTGSYSPSGAVSGLQDGSVSGYYKLGGKPSYVKLQLGGGNTFQAGDSIILEIRAGDLDPATGTGSQATTPVRLFTDAGTTAFYTSSALTANTLHTVRIKVTATMISAGLSNTIYIYRTKDDSTSRYSQNHQVKSIAVKHCTPSCSTPAAPTAFAAGSITTTGATFTITDAGDAASYDIFYSTSSDEPTSSTAATTTSASKTKAVTGLTASTTYYAWVRSVCDATHKSAWVALSGSSFTTTAAAATYTVTYNAQGGSVTPSSETVSTATLPTPTKSGYTFDGWYTSGGSKITGTYNPTADITLYAQWQSTDCDAGGTTTLEDINFKDVAWSGETFSQGNTTDEDVINGVYFWAKSDNASKQFSLTDNTTKGLTFPDNNISSGNYYFCIPITGINSSNKQITITLKHGYDKGKAQFKYVYVDGRTEYVAGNTNSSGGTAQSDTNNSDTEITFTLSSLKNNAGHLMIGRSSSSYTNIYGVTVTTPGAAGTCYYVTYNGNGATGGYTTDEAAYASGDNATAATNSFTKTGYTFGGWATSQANADAGTKTYDAGDKIAISGNTTLYAIWQAAGYTLAWNTNGGSALSGTYSSGSFADGATITAPSDPTLSNYNFNSWNTAGDGTGNAYTGTMPAANTTYYAVWGQTVTLDANTDNHGSLAGSATAILGRAGLTGITHATPASGYKLTGYYTATTEGTKVLNSDGTFAATSVTDYITSGKWSRTGAAPTLYAQYEASGSLKWNLGVKTTAESLTTSSKESSFTEISTSNMSNATVYGVTYTASSKNNLTGQISTPAAYDADKYVYVTFKVADGYKFTPSSISVKVQPVGENEHKAVKLSLTDATNTLVSGSATKCDGTSSGKTTTVTLAGNGTYFTGTVKLKIYVYADATASVTTNNCYRLGTPIEIQGAIEAACTTMPSFTQMNYTTTTFAPNADASGSPITIVGGENIDTYQWKYNTTNDRTSGTDCGSDEASLVPLTNAAAATDGTRYYWCEMTNTDCRITIKSPAVAITVRANKSEASVTWMDPANEPNYGGGGYVIRATMNSGYDGTLSAEDLTAPAGIRITNVSIDNAAAQKYIEATFDVTTAFNRDENSKISFTLSHDATTGYDAISDEHDVDYDACSGGEEGSAAIALTSAIHDEGSGNAPRYWFETIGVGRVFGLNYGKATLGTSSDAAFSTEGYSYVASSTSQRWVFQPYVEGVTKIRVYIKSAINKLRVLSIGKSASWNDQSGKYSNIAVDTIIYSNDKTTGLDNTENGYAEIQFSSALTKNNYYMITMSSASTYIYGVTLYSGSVGDGGNLATSLTFANTGPIAANASTANFQNIASKSGENSNTLGTITYSSNNDAATVNATTGEVSIHAKETAQAVTITATLSASGCYQGATATYTINVAADECGEPSGSIELTTGSATKCSSESVTLTMTGFTSGATVEWYNGDTKVNGASGYTIETSGSTSTLETSNAGTYSAIAKVTGGCPSGAGRTNSITISNIAVDASATKIVDKWYVKNGRLTPDIALWSLDEGTHPTVTITRDDAEDVSAIGLTASDFTELDGVVYLSGKEPSANETGADVEYTLTLTVKDACGTDHPLSGQTIKLTHQKNTDKHVLAFVVNGTVKGGFTEGITAGQTTSVGLYNAIAAQFDVQATNIYATDDEKKLKEYYSQYDILCITDYPNTKTKGVNSKSYVDAIGALIDIRPILTMEAYVSSLANWKAKGLSGNPKSPTTRQYTMDLQCKDHEIFAGTDLTKVGDGDEAMYRVSMVDSTKEDYATLDATYGATLPHKEKESKSGAGDGGYNYGGKPALQGFTFTEEMSNNDLLPIGLIGDGAGNPLQVGIERQHNMEARLMVLGINSYAMERLTNDGERVVINALNYLMKKNAEDIADCSTSFVGGAEGHEKNWDYAANWTGNTVPLPTQKVRILADCEVSSTVYAQSVLIVTNGEYNHGSDIAAGKLTIKENGALIVSGKIQAASAPAYNRPRATTPDKLLIETSSTNQAALIFDNEEGETQATVQMYSPSYWEVQAGTNKKKSYWSYVAIPIQDAYVGEFFYGAVTYLYDETSGWIRKKIGSHFYAFDGIGLSLPEGHTETFYGALAPTGEKDVTLTVSACGGENLIGNSWTAPIQIANFEASDFGSATQNVMIYCTGRDGTQDDVKENAEYVTATAENDGNVNAGQWLTIPIGVPSLDGYDGLKVIPAMQAFQVNTATETTLRLDYNKLVRDVDVSDNLTEKQHAPARRSSGAKKSLMSTMRVRVSGVKTRTDVWLLEDDRFSDEFDNGWEAKYVECDDRSAQLYAQSETGNMSFLAKPDIEGTVLGFAPSKDGNQYLFTFHYVGDDEYYLNDLKLKQSTLIRDENSYLFTFEEGDTNRFYISRQPLGGPAITTGVENLDSQTPKAQKIIYNGKLYIIRGGYLYDATGKVVK